MAATAKKSMRLFILGATGGVGQELVDQALVREHHVTAFVRTPQKLGPAREGLAVIQGNLLAADAVADALACHDAVLSAIGPPGLGRSTITSDAAQATVTAMKATGTRRIVIVGVGMLFADSGLLGRVLRTHSCATSPKTLPRWRASSNRANSIGPLCDRRDSRTDREQSDMASPMTTCHEVRAGRQR
jgi:putative NADH-flavin reductase